MSKQQLFLLVFIIALAMAAVPGIMIGTPETVDGEEAEGETQVRELDPQVRRQLPETNLELTPTTEEEKAEIRYARKININEADIDELQEIPRVGINTAERIVGFREGGGVFHRVEDLTQIKRIGDRTVENMRPYITVGREYESDVAAERADHGDKIDINEASSERLQELTGVGPATANAIVEYRDRRGGFARPEDLKNVRGIGPSTFADMQDQVEVTGAVSPTAPPGASAGGKININEASAGELEELPGIGATYAERIVEYRDRHGSFSSLDELVNVSGIGPATVSGLRDEAEI